MYGKIGKGPPHTPIVLTMKVGCLFIVLALILFIFETGFCVFSVNSIHFYLTCKTEKNWSNFFFVLWISDCSGTDELLVILHLLSLSVLS